MTRTAPGLRAAAPEVVATPPGTACDPCTAPAVAATRRALRALLACHDVVEVPPGTRRPAALALHLGVPVGALATTHLLRGRSGGGDLLVVASGTHHLLPSALAAVLGRADLVPATDAEVLERTGAVLGAGSPVGLAPDVPVLVDVALAAHAVLWVPAGHPRVVFRTRYDELLRLSGGHPVEIG